MFVYTTKKEGYKFKMGFKKMHVSVRRKEEGNTTFVSVLLKKAER